MHSPQKQCMAHAGCGPSLEEANKQEHAPSTERQLAPIDSYSEHLSSGAVRPSPVTGWAVM